MKLRIFSFLIVLFLSLAAAPAVDAQCPMCRISAETNLKSGGKAGRGLNAGILYMLAMPYLLVGGIGYWWWKNRRKTDMSDSPDEMD